MDIINELKQSNPCENKIWHEYHDLSYGDFGEIKAISIRFC